uniref:Putative TetR-family transcriptional regulator n=1 Tax=Streptomyces paromomycinus TaxID=92743 RepID=Q2MF41_STREY|nr:putative TetR-family transcriptional regulator [Streptomyces paromomycinus]
MSSTGTASTRDRLLDAAAELFYREGASIGVETLCRTAGISKRSMYQLFDRRANSRPLIEQLALRTVEAGPPRTRILYVFERLEKLAETADYRGCPFLAAQVELKDPGHPASIVAEEVKRHLTDAFRAEAERGGAADPELLARQLTLVFDGASARAGARVESLAGLAVTTAAALLDAAGVA